MITDKLKYLALATALSSLLLSCGGDEEDPVVPTPPPTPTAKGKYYTKTIEMPAEASENVVALTPLSSAVSRTAGSASWLTITTLSYSSGTPQVKVAATANVLTEARQQNVTFYAAKDTLLLTVRQSGAKAGGTDVANPNDTPTDQPAFAPRR